MVRRSQALQEFRSSIAIAEVLIKKEKKFRDPAPTQSRKIVLGLKGGAAVLMVAAFENFLKELVEEKIDDMKDHPKYNPKKLPDLLLSHNCSYTFKNTSQLSGRCNDPKDKITIFQRAAQAIINGDIDTSFFSDLAQSNPNSVKVKYLFLSLGITDIFSSIKKKFDVKWKTPTSSGFIPAKLDEIVNRRHVVAHTANAMKVTRIDLIESVKFLKILADLFDEELYHHFKKVIK